MVTDLDGHITQNVVYIPYGEVFVEERNGSWASSYLFNAKELDEETGLYYYGARYLDPVGARWLSVDPMWENDPDKTPYNYYLNNPVKLVDPDGRRDIINAETNEHQYVDDNVNRVIQIVGEDYETLKSIGFNQNNNLYSEIVARGSEREDLFYTVNNVLENKKFIPYGTMPKCCDNARLQNNSLTRDYTCRIDMYNTSSTDLLDFDGGVNYIKDQLLKGKSLVAGVEYGGKVSNFNPTTDHFLNIVGMGFEYKNGRFMNYFSYYDNATKFQLLGTDTKSNRLYFGTLKSGERVFYDNTNVLVQGREPLTYILSEIRRNK